MSGKEKETEMMKFKNSTYKLLVATTVIEVGVDVPDATIIIIENSNRFGLSQLHQLRGRVGRGSKQSYCILIFDQYLSITAKKRLNVIRESNDGFYISEQDFKIRGSGKIIGLEQSGFRQFKFANFFKYSHLIQQISFNIKNELKNNKLSDNDIKNIEYLMRIFNFVHENNLDMIGV